METDFQGFHEGAQFSTNSLLSSDEVAKYQLKVLESIKNEDNILWQDEIMMTETALGKEDFQQIMSDWQNHVGSLHITEPEDVDVPLDILNSSDVFFDDKSPILLKALNSSVQKLENVTEAASDLLGIKKEPSFDGDPCDSYLKIHGEQRYYSESIKTESSFDDSTELYSKIQNDQPYIKSEPTVLRKLTLLNGEKELLGKNIIGLHSLNEIKENPDQNCQVTSTVINGKRYKIIIKPKSQRLQKFNEEKIKKTLIKKLSKCTLVPKSEPKEDEIISEMRNGNYDVPILGSDTLLSWDMTWCDTPWDNPSDNNSGDIKMESDAELPKKVPPLKIKIPKIKKCKKKRCEVKSDEEIDVETIGDRAEGEEPEDKVVKVQEVKDNMREKKTYSSNENIRKRLPKEMVDQIESLKRKKDGRIPLVQVIPARKNVRNGTRMQDAAAAINRNKLLKIVSGGDTVQLDHDYCSNTFKNFEVPQNKSVPSDPDVNLTEKNPKKDSGMESGDVSDASEDPQTPESVHNLQSIQQINNKLLEERRNGKASAVTKVAAALFRATNVITSNGTVNNSDVVKTMVVSNGNKALTNDVPGSTSIKAESDKSDIVPSGSSDYNSNSVSIKTDADGDNSSVACSEQAHTPESERPKKKLKLEEYLSRRNGKVDEIKKDLPTYSKEKNRPSNLTEAVESTVEKAALEVSEEKEVKREETETKEENTRGNARRSRSKSKKSRGCRNQRSPSTSSGERDDRRDRERSSRSRSSWRGSRKDSWNRHKRRSSTSSERKRSFWSRSLSRSSSRESSSSSDRSGSRRKRRISPVWYHRKSRSRSISRERSRSRNRSYSNRRRQNHYINRNFYSRREPPFETYSNSPKERWLMQLCPGYCAESFKMCSVCSTSGFWGYLMRSRSPYRNHTMREKQRQIEERRVIYIGRIEEGMTNAKLRERFSVFGPIVDISLHFREYGDNYGFVTYAYKDDAYDAVEHGNDDPSLPRYDLCFGGRRGFCKERYADLDGMPTSYSGFKDAPILRSEESFDLLLKKAQAKLKNRIHKSGKT